MCNRDCFNCLFEDCIFDGILPQERQEIAQRDREINFENKDNKYRKKLGQQRKYRAAHKEEILEQYRIYRQNHKEEIAERKRKYYAMHKEEILERKRKNYQKKKNKKSTG